MKIIRKIKFNKNGIFVTTDLLSNTLGKSINLFKFKVSIDVFDFKNLELAYDKFLPLKKPKYDEVNVLLNYVAIFEKITF